MYKGGQWIGILSCCFAVCFAQGPTVTRPNSDGSTIVTLDEGLAVNSPVLTVAATTPIITVALTGAGSATSDLKVVAETVQTAILLDYETTQSYSVTLTVTDAGGSSTVVFTLQVRNKNDEKPVLPAASNTFSVTFNENLPARTQVFPPFTVTDADPNDSHTFTLTGSQSNLFTCDSATGAITSNTQMDRDPATATRVFTGLLLTVRDAAGNTATQALTVTLLDVNDNAPKCTRSVYVASIAENTPAGTPVVTLTCTDIDASPNGDVTLYVKSSGDDTAAKFTMASKEVRTTAVPLNYEVKKLYFLVINVVDGGTPPQTGSTTVLVLVTGVNEFPPVWAAFAPSGPTFTRPESIGVGTVLTTITATDADSGVDGQLAYSIVSVTDAGGNAASNILRVDATSGEVMTLSALDYDASVNTRSYIFVVQATDKGTPPRSVTTSLTLSLQDVNDNSPVFSAKTYSATIEEAKARANNWAGFPLTATDADPSSTPLIFQITGGNSLNKFILGTSPAGTLRLNAAIDVDAPTKNPYIYVLSLQVSDGGVPGTPARIDTATVTITISPITNDHNPVFGTPTPSANPTIAETVPIGTTVATLPVTDNDRDNGAAQTITFAITGGNTDNDMTIDTTLGVVTTAKTLDYERTTSYALVIEATDSGSSARTSTFTLSITVVNVNEHKPTCTSYNLVAFVNEEAAAQQISSLTCSDSDAGDTLRYSILSILPAVGSFTINTASGAVSTLTALNYEVVTTYTLKILVSDTLATALTSTVTLVVNVQPVNEFSPVFFPLSYTAVVAENVAAGTSVAKVTATDSDQGLLQGTISYSIAAGNGPGFFTINSVSGLITTTSVKLDRETAVTHTLTVRASDDTPGTASSKFSSATVVVTVTDVNDNTPICTPVQYKARVTEPSVKGAVVVTLTVRDDDEANTPNSTPTLTVTGGNTGSVFGTNGRNLVLDKVVDYETTKSFTLIVTVKDGAPAASARSSSCTVHVTIVAAGEFPPVFTVPNHSTTIAETEAIGTTIYKAQATDADLGVGANVTYSILSGNTNDAFYLYSTTGEVVVWNQLDYDKPPQSYRLTLEAKDDAGQTGTMWLDIQLSDSNDQTPVFTQNIYTFTVNENVATGTPVGTVRADDTDTGVLGTVRYTAVSGNGLPKFAVDPGTGAVTTRGTLDRETRRDYNIVIRAADGGAPPLTSTALVSITVNDLNDNAPVFTPQRFIVSISENAGVGTSVTTVTAKDADSSASNNVFTYFLANTHFAVNSASGVVSTTKVLDRETTASYVLNVLAPDSGVPVLTGTAIVTVIIDDVNDNTPVITGTYTPSVSEGARIGTIVTTIVATDADAGDNARLSYVIVSGNTNNDFIISVDGIIQVRNTLNRERTSVYTLRVDVHDNGSPQLTAQTTVTITVTDINDNAPKWGNLTYFFTVSENVAAGQSVGQVVATDADVGVNAAITYSVVLFWTGNAAHFVIDGATGIIRTTAMLDRESTAQYSGRVRATDAGTPQLHADVNVTIAVTDLNDNAPVFDKTSYNVSVTENSPVGTGVFTVTVTDADIGVNDDVTLSIDTGYADGARANTFFKVTSGTGVVAVNSLIDRETDTSFTFRLLAIDAGTPSHTSSADVTITVVDVNDNAPIFTQTYFNAAVDYAGQCTKSIVTLTATDRDSGVNGQVTYHLQTSDNSHLFQVDATSGQLSLQSSLTAHVMYTLTVTARDEGTPTQSAATPAVVRVDGMVPNDVVVTFKLGITVTAFLAQQATFLSQLQVIMRATYPTAVAKLWCAETNGDGLADVHVYFLKDDSTETVANINAAKSYVAQDKARSVFTSDPAGTPGTVLSGSQWSPFDIKSVQPYKETQKPWAETWEGIAIITACCIVGLALLICATYMFVRFCRLCRGARFGTPRKVFVKERNPSPKNNVHPQKQPNREPPARHPDRSYQFPNENKPRPMRIDEPDLFWDGTTRP